MRALRLFGWATVLAVAPSFLLARVHPFGDAGLYSRTAVVDPIPAQAEMPTDVRTLLNAKCVDCHSSQTRPPLYGRFAPISWLLERDINEARKQMNLSNWNSYTPEQQDTLKSKALQQAKAGAMPLPQYRAIHWSTRITPEDIQTLAGWAHASVTGNSTGQATMPGDPTRGQAVFEKRCTGCHALTTDREGPRLQGVYGRPTASIQGFPYSTALRHANGVWDEKSLDQWLTEPDSFIANSNMDFRVAKPQERKDLIAFFASAQKNSR
jgi:cytochrome c